MKLVIGIPHHDHFTVAWPFVASLLPLAKDHEIIHESGSLVSDVRNRIYTRAQKMDADLLLMIDSDMIFEPDAVPALLVAMQETEADMVSALFFRGDGKPSAYEYADNQIRGRFAPIQDYSERKEVPACGLAFNLISRKALYGLGEKPFDRYQRNGTLVGEDISFCDAMREKDMKIVLEPSVKVGHLRLGSINENYRDSGMRAWK